MTEEIELNDLGKKLFRNENETEKNTRNEIEKYLVVVLLMTFVLLYIVARGQIVIT